MSGLQAVRRKGEQTRPPRAGSASGRERDGGQPGSASGDGSRLRLFLQANAIDFALVLAVSASLAFTVSYGFWSAGALRGNVALICAMQAPLLTSMFWGTWSKRVLAPSIAATAILATIVVGAATALSTAPLFADGAYNDVDGNYATFAIVSVVTVVACFLLSRRRVGLFFLLVAGIVSCGAVQFLWREWIAEEPGLLATAAFLVGTAMLFVYQTYKQSVYSAKRAKRTSFLGAFAFSALVGVMCVLAGLAVFYGGISLLGMQTPEIKPFELVVARPVDDRTGVYSTYDVEGSEKTDQVEDGDKDTSDDTQGTSENDASGPDTSSSGAAEAMSQVFRAFDASSWEDGEDPVSYQIIRLTVYVTAAVIALLFLVAVLLQRHRRKWRLKRLEKKGVPYAGRIWSLYGFLMGRLSRMKIRKPAHLTPLEFAAGFDAALAPFENGTDGVTFLEVTGAYMDACWGGEDVGEEEYSRVVSFYEAFFANARRYLGWPKWLFFKFWRI